MGTRDEPVANCNSRALSRSANSVTISHHQTTNSLSNVKLRYFEFDFQSDTSILPKIMSQRLFEVTQGHSPNPVMTSSSSFSSNRFFKSSTGTIAFIPSKSALNCSLVPFEWFEKVSLLSAK